MGETHSCDNLRAPIYCGSPQPLTVVNWGVGGDGLIDKGLLLDADLEDWGERCYVKDLKSRNKVCCSAQLREFAIALKKACFDSIEATVYGTRNIDPGSRPRISESGEWGP
jgi:hypothetical protein